MTARILILAALFLAVASATADELVVNADFEQPASTGTIPDSWRGDTGVYFLDRTVKRSGEASLKYENADPNRYRLAAQTVPLHPGRKYRFSAWIKTDGISGQESGATICLEWQDKGGKWMGGSYPSGVKGTADWRQVEGVVRIPKEAGSVNLQCYVRKGMTGTAWFDDVAIERIIDPPMRTVLISPNYRGRITGEEPEEASVRILGTGGFGSRIPSVRPGETLVRVHLDLTDFDLPLEKLNLGWLLSAADGTRLDGRDGIRPAVRTIFTPSQTIDVPTDLPIPLPTLEPGRYELAIHLLDPDKKVLQESKHTLERVADDFKPTCSIDTHGRLLVEGKPFLPLGMYWSGINEDDLKTYADSKFNCLMPYGSPNEEQMDLAQRYGMKVIYSVKDFYAGSRHAPGFIKTEADEKPNVLDRVKRFADHPALLAWYLNDELPQSFLPRLEAHQRWVAEADPNHPTWVVLYQFREVGAYINTFDVIGTDPYPIGRAPASEAATWTAETRRQVDYARPVWQVPQVHNWINYRKDDGKSDDYHSPTYDEMRSMAWQCLCEGATGLVFYSWFDLKRNPDVPFEQQWGELKRIAAEIDELAPILLSVEEDPSFRLKVGTKTQPPWLHTLVRHHQGKAYIFAVNDGDGSGEVNFGVSQRYTNITTHPIATLRPWRVKSARDLTDNRVLDSSRFSNIRVLKENEEFDMSSYGGHEFADSFEPLSVHVYELTRATE